MEDAGAAEAGGRRILHLEDSKSTSTTVLLVLAILFLDGILISFAVSRGIDFKMIAVAAGWGIVNLVFIPVFVISLLTEIREVALHGDTIEVKKLFSKRRTELGNIGSIIRYGEENVELIELGKGRDAIPVSGKGNVDTIVGILRERNSHLEIIDSVPE